jgi:uncharacterized ferritin-like protein (DUF455 family)
MDTISFVHELETFKTERLSRIVAAGQTSLGGGPADAERLLEVALANEINVSELAATWMPSTAEIDVKVAFARQAGDEAGHFQLVADRLAALGFDVAGFSQPTETPLFRYLRGLSATVERVAAGLFTLESIAYAVNENFIAFCEERGDAETVRIYRAYIQPDERAHQELGQKLLAKYANTPELQRTAREAVAKVLEITAVGRAQVAQRLGTACFPGC